MSYPLLLAQRCPSSCLCSRDSASRDSDDDGVAYTVEYKDDSLSTAIYREGAIALHESTRKQCQFWNAFDSQIFLQHNSVIQDKLEQNPCQNSIGSANLNRTQLATT